MTMAHSLEARSPFLDHQLVEYLAKIPACIKIKHGQPKYILRKLAGDYLPDSIVRREKQGFMFPIAYWFRTDLYGSVREALSNSFFIREGLFRSDAVDRLLQEHRSNRRDHHVRLWMLLNLEIWYQLFIDRVGPEASAEKLFIKCLPQ
jgi:asparagine synthase (glutamine-hydrolysing)